MDQRRVVCLIGNDVEMVTALALKLNTPHFDTRCFSTVSQFLSETISAPGCVLVGPEVPIAEGQHLLAQLKSSQSTLSVVLLADTIDVATAVSLMQEGATALLQVPFEVPAVLEAVESALLRSSKRHSAQQLVTIIRAKLSRLSDDEHQVLTCLLKGLSNKAIARALKMSMRTVDRRRSSIMEKMQVESLPELAVMLGDVELP